MWLHGSSTILAPALLSLIFSRSSGEHLWRCLADKFLHFSVYHNRNIVWVDCKTNKSTTHHQIGQIGITNLIMNQHGTGTILSTCTVLTCILLSMGGHISRFLEDIYLKHNIHYEEIMCEMNCDWHYPSLLGNTKAQAPCWICILWVFLIFFNVTSTVLEILHKINCETELALPIALLNSMPEPYVENGFSSYFYIVTLTVLETSLKYTMKPKLILSTILLEEQDKMSTLKLFCCHEFPQQLWRRYFFSVTFAMLEILYNVNCEIEICTTTTSIENMAQPPCWRCVGC